MRNRQPVYFAWYFHCALLFSLSASHKLLPPVVHYSTLTLSTSSRSRSAAIIITAHHTKKETGNLGYTHSEKYTPHVAYVAVLVSALSHVFHSWLQPRHIRNVQAAPCVTVNHNVVVFPVLYVLQVHYHGTSSVVYAHAVLATLVLHLLLLVLNPVLNALLAGEPPGVLVHITFLVH